MLGVGICPECEALSSEAGRGKGWSLHPVQHVLCDMFVSPEAYFCLRSASACAMKGLGC